MRKHIIIGLLALTVIGVMAFFVSGPKRGSVEWHKREYLRARHWGKLDRWFENNAPYNLREANMRRKGKRAERHLSALFKLGYLSTKKFVITNRDLYEVFAPLKGGQPPVRTEHQLFTMLSPGVNADTNVIWITAPPETMSEFEEFIGQADVPESER